MSEWGSHVYYLGGSPRIEWREGDPTHEDYEELQHEAARKVEDGAGRWSAVRAFTIGEPTEGGR